MKNHGALTLGSNPERAMLNVEVLEKCAAAFLLAYYTGERLTRSRQQCASSSFPSCARTRKKEGHQRARKVKAHRCLAHCDIK